MSILAMWPDLQVHWYSAFLSAQTRYLQFGLVNIILDQEASQDVAPGG
jgi:hypothetical protein